MKTVGITGGIGSGKSTVCKILEILGYAVYYADNRGKALMEHDPAVKEKVIHLFGSEAYTPAGVVNRSWIGARVFSDEALLQNLNAIVHPAVAKDFFAWKLGLEQTSNPMFVFKEAAILYESGSYKECDAVVTVFAPKNLRLQRVRSRDQSNMEAVLNRMDKQWPDLQKINHADYVIYNDGNHMLIPQVRECLSFLLG